MPVTLIQVSHHQFKGRGWGVKAFDDLDDFFGGWGVQNLAKPDDVLLERPLKIWNLYLKGRRNLKTWDARTLGRFENQKFSIFLKSQADLHVAHKNKASQYKILP